MRKSTVSPRSCQTPSSVSIFLGGRLVVWRAAQAEMQRATTSADHLQAEKRALEDRLRQAESEAREWRFRAEGGASELARSTAEKVHIETVHAEQLLRERAQLADRLAEALQTADDEVRRWRTKAEEEADNLIRATSEKARAEAMLAEAEARVAVAEHDGGLSKLDRMTTQAVVDGLRSEKLELEDRLLQTEREMREWVSRTEAGASELGRVQALLAANQALLAANQARIVELELKDRLGQKLAPQLQAAMQEIVELRHRVQGEAADANHVAMEKARIENLLSGQFHTEKRQWQIEKRQLEEVHLAMLTRVPCNLAARVLLGRLRLARHMGYFRMPVALASSSNQRRSPQATDATGSVTHWLKSPK